MKKLIFVALAAAISMTALPGCKKDDPQPIEYELHFNEDDWSNVTTDNIRNVLNTVGTDNVIIYLVPTGNWDKMQSNNIHSIRKNGLEPALQVASNIRGRGDFNFRVGHASRVPEDSLWYVQHGWTINKHLQK